MTNEELKDYYGIYTDAWKLFKKYSEPDGSKEYWSNVTKEANEFYKQHKDQDFASKMMVTTMKGLKDIQNRRENGET